MSMTGCSGSKAKVLEAVGDYCDAVVDMDLSKIDDLTSDDLEDADTDLQEDLDLENEDIYHGEATEFVAAVADTLTYEIDEASLWINKDHATVDVKFSTADYEALLEDEDLNSIDLTLDALKDAGTSDVYVTLSLIKTSEGWKIEGAYDDLSGVYGFTKTKDLFFFERIENWDLVRRDGIIGVSFEQCEFEQGDWTIGHRTIDSDFGLTMVTHGSEDYSGYYAVVEHNGEVVAYEEDSISIHLRSSELGSIENGDYYFMFFDPDGELYFGCQITSEV